MSHYLKRILMPAIIHKNWKQTNNLGVITNWFSDYSVSYTWWAWNVKCSLTWYSQALNIHELIVSNNARTTLPPSLPHNSTPGTVPPIRTIQNFLEGGAESRVTVMSGIVWMEFSRMGIIPGKLSSGNYLLWVSRGDCGGLSYHSMYILHSPICTP